MTTKRYHKIDGWRGYSVPALAIVGASDTGTWDDSPCPSNLVKAELRRFQREVLKPAGIASRTRYGASSNVFCMKRWLVVKQNDFDTAAKVLGQAYSLSENVNIGIRYAKALYMQGALTQFSEVLQQLKQKHANDPQLQQLDALILPTSAKKS